MIPLIRRSREILKLFNYDFIFFLQGIFLRVDYIKQKLEFFLAWGWYL